MEGYTEDIVYDFENRLETIFERQVNRVHVLYFEGLTPEMRQDLAKRLSTYTGDDGQDIFMSNAWRRLFEIQAPLVREFILDFFSICKMGSEMRMIACSISWRSQAPEKVTLTDLFYLKGMDVGSVNIPYLLAKYLRLSKGQFVACLAKHFGLLTKERLQGLTMIVRDLPVIDMDELVAAVGAPKAAEDAPIANEGALDVLAPVQAPQPPHPAARPARTMAQRLAKVEEYIHKIRGTLGEQREVLDSMACDFSRLSTWTVVRLSQMMSQVGVRYTSYANFQIPYVRRTKRRNDNASTSTTIRMSSSHTHDLTTPYLFVSIFCTFIIHVMMYLTLEKVSQYGVFHFMDTVYWSPIQFI
nr:hypothetical protein [Tanacetum cinerariifolium]